MLQHYFIAEPTVALLIIFFSQIVEAITQI